MKRTAIKFTFLLFVATLVDCNTELGTHLPLESEDECGHRLSSGYIVGGEVAKRGEFPFVASLGYKSPVVEGGIIYACGGALINRRYVLTAAHCHDIKQPVAEVVLGEHDFSQDPDCPTCSPVQRFIIDPADVFVHPGFDQRKPDAGDDIALIRLPSLATTIIEDDDQLVLPVCMPWNETSEIKENEFFVMGWGRTNNDDTDSGSQKKTGAFINILQQLQVPLVSNEDCKKKPIFKNVSPEKHVCAGGEKDKDSCSGDSGGPLVSRENRESKMYLKGIVSFGTKMCGKGFPGVYTNVKHYIPWIKEHLQP